ncbi:MAG: glycosyltransferase family 39 protein [Bacteroidales bacterium]|nr:glycosyltransferase family 39 protein [Bacteroidales bacterium]
MTATKPDTSLWRNNLLITLSAAVLFIPFLGGVHLFDWDEINFAESAREMIATGDYLTVQINYIPFWEKPPLFIWMQVLSMKIFGISEFAARFPNAICGIASLLILYNSGRKLVDNRFGLLWVLFYAGSILPFFYFKSGIIDPWFNLFIFLGVLQIYRYFKTTEKSRYHAAGAGFFIGLAILTKGPVALLVFILTIAVFLLVKKFRVRMRFPDVLIFILILVFTGGFWFILQTLKGKFSLIADFMIYQIRLFRTQDAGHGGFLLYHFVVLFAGVFPASVFALPVLFGTREKSGRGKDFYLWMLILFWVVLILFTIVRTKIVHYSSLCYFPLTFLAAWSFYHAASFTRLWEPVTQAIILILGLLLGILSIMLTYIDRFKEFIIGRNWIDDPFAEGCLMADGGWKGFEFMGGLVLLMGITFFAFFWKRNRYDKAVMILSGTIPVFMMIAMLLIVPRVETYSQRAAIDFFISVSDQDAYLETIGYKSYAHLFYGKVRKPAMNRDEKWLLTGPLDKDAYFSIKITGKDRFLVEYPDAELLYERNGFVFFKRTPKMVHD